MTGDESSSQTEKNLLDYSCCVLFKCACGPSRLQASDYGTENPTRGKRMKTVLKWEALREKQSQVWYKRGPLTPRQAQH